MQLALSVALLAVAFSATAQQIDWPKVNDEAMRNYQSLVQIDSTTTEAGVAEFVKKVLEAEGIQVSLVGAIVPEKSVAKVTAALYLFTENAVK